MSRLRKRLVEGHKEEVMEKKEKGDDLYTPIDAKLIVSTGSTLLDLALSGGRIRGGGIPGGIMMEIFGPSARARLH